MAATKEKAIPYETAARSFERILIPALQNGRFSDLFEKNEAVNKAVRNMLDAADNEGKLGDAKELFMGVTKQPEERFIYLVNMQRRLREGSIMFSPPFSKVKPLATG